MSILDIILIILIISWFGGFAFKVGGALIHILLLLFIIGLVARLLGVSF